MDLIRRVLLRLVDLCWPFESTAPETNLGTVGFMRCVQNEREIGARRNPDDLVKYFLKPIDRIKVYIVDVRTFRETSYYHHLLARTLFYDEVLADAIADNCKQIVFIGVGTDTRALRFKKQLDEKNILVIENDLNPWIGNRIQLSAKLDCPSKFVQMELDLDKINYLDWIKACDFNCALKTQFIVEGVSRYVRPESIKQLLMFFAEFTQRDSKIAFDFTLVNNRDSLTVDSGFRMASERDHIHNFIKDAGLGVHKLLIGAEVQHEYLNYQYDCPDYKEDGVVIATIAQPTPW